LDLLRAVESQSCQARLLAEQLDEKAPLRSTAELKRTSDARPITIPSAIC